MLTLVINSSLLEPAFWKVLLSY